MVEEGSACQSKQQMMDATFYAWDFNESTPLWQSKAKYKNIPEIAISSNWFRKKLGEKFSGEFLKIPATKSSAIFSLILYNTTCYNLSIVAGSYIFYEFASNMLQIDLGVFFVYFFFLCKALQKYLRSFRFKYYFIEF